MGKETFETINPKVVVGEICKTNNDGDVVILSKCRKENGVYMCTVRFVETGNEYTVAVESMKKGVVRDNLKDRTPVFVEKARKVHGDKYDYSQTKYVNSTTKLTIICPQHGPILTHPQTHLGGSGCPKCSMKAVHEAQSLTTEEFVESCIEKFGDKYDYSRVKYVNSKTPIEVGCPEHGWFSVLPFNYKTYKLGCAQCAEVIRAKEYAIPFTEFVERSQAIHGNRYIYHEEDYTYIKNKTRITCREHGDWWINGIHHTRGTGCAKCAQVALKTTDDFIREAKLVHGDKYDYTDTVYTRNKYKVEIRCPEHGVFRQQAGSHLRGSGCSACGRTGFDQTMAGSFYVLESKSLVKVGITNRDTAKRLKEINFESPERFSVVLDIGLDGWQCRELETRMLRWLGTVAKPAQDKFQGSSECFMFIDSLTVTRKAIEVLEEING